MRRISTADRFYEYDENAKKLGSGSFANVYKGIKCGTNEEVAVKVINKAAMQKYGDDIIQAIGSEVNILQQISQMSVHDPCPFIVRIFDCFETQNSIYIILEFCNEGNLLEQVNRNKKQGKKFNEGECAFIMYQQVLAVEYLSRNGITHRDIKPENVFISNGVYKLGDFGFASQKNLFSTTLGTYPYMAPEFFTEQSYNKSIDVWALGIMYHELLFNELYFIGQSTIEVSKKIIEKPYVIQKAHLISPESQDLLTQMIEKNHRIRITAEGAKNHKLFQQFQNDPRIVNLIQPLQARTKSDEILDEIQHIRNGCLFLYDLGEMLEQGRLKEFRFDIFYLYKRGIIKLLALGDSLSKREVPQGCAYPAGQDWQNFINSQHYTNCITLLDNDRKVLTQKFQTFFAEIDRFVASYFQNDLNQIKEIINDDLQKDVQQTVYQEQLKSAFQQNLDAFQMISDKSSYVARGLLLASYMLAIAQDIDTAIQQKLVNFEQFQREKQQLSVQDIFTRISALKR